LTSRAWVKSLNTHDDGRGEYIEILSKKKDFLSLLDLLATGRHLLVFRL
jgi:hypothetical protein